MCVKMCVFCFILSIKNSAIKLCALPFITRICHSLYFIFILCAHIIRQSNDTALPVCMSRTLSSVIFELSCASPYTDKTAKYSRVELNLYFWFDDDKHSRVEPNSYFWFNDGNWVDSIIRSTIVFGCNRTGSYDKG